MRRAAHAVNIFFALDGVSRGAHGVGMEQLIAQIEAYCAARGISEASLGTYALRNDRTVQRIREGRASFNVAERLQAWMRDNPPKQDSAA